ncbi:Wzz/FepE/Etk N-terminal domain-containing protein [Chromobacterium aquaticum]|uniref:Wzz/FepE/Etk N-terminal domain-containing protein n=1 Tax=Chromobacterium aquaticum TaxID=467180 RepID=A0ABV8ZP26_9NEIS|nr:Wzz/FepE/Etk N-terminal domain-containing protein [Chromobacterium aquaticum]MCD5361021.1 Wzz/FepE/Etk N-terminal domain-containing protein [Chromobacterium aquaticum]
MEQQREVSDEISLVDIILFCRKQWRLMVMLPVAAVILAIAIVMNMPPRYTATSLLLVPAPLGPQGGASVLKDSSLLDRAVTDFELAKHYELSAADKTKLSLLDNLKVNAGKDGLLEVSVSDADAVFAAKLANYLVEQARQKILGLHVTEQSKKYLVLQEKIKATQQQLAVAQRQLKQQGGGEALLNSELARIVDGFARLEVQMNTQQMEGNSPLQSSLLQLRAELERANPRAKSISSQQLAMMRNFFFYQAALEELQKQALVSKALVSQEVQVVLPASPPLEKSGPRRALVVVLAGLLGFALAVLIGAGRNVLDSSRRRLQQATET